MEKKSLIITFLYTLVLIFIQAISYISVDLEKPVFIVSNILFSLFVISKIFTLRKEKLFLLNPMFLACLKMFLFAYGLTIFYIYFEDVPLLDTIVVYSPYRYMNNIMIYASIAFISTWYSYHSTFIARIAERFFNFITRNKKILRKELTPKWILIYTIFILSIVFKLILISYGVYGVIGTILAETIEIPFLNVIVVLSSAGSGALLFLNFYYFKTGNKKYLFFIFFFNRFFLLHINRV